MDFNKLQQEIEVLNNRICNYYKLAGGSSERENALMLKIGEEYGELCEAMLASNGMQREEKMVKINGNEVEHELADLIVASLTLAVDQGMDVEKMIKEKLALVRKRFPA